MTQDEICAKYSQLLQYEDDYEREVAAGGNMSATGLSFIRDFEKKYPAYKRCQLSEEVVEESQEDYERYTQQDIGAGTTNLNIQKEKDAEGKRRAQAKKNKEGNLEEEVVKEETEKLNETFTSKKDQLLFERLTNKWAK
jgi:hypothetical protein